MSVPQTANIRPPMRGAGKGAKAARRFVLLFALFAGAGFVLLFVPPIEPRVEDLSRAITAVCGAIIHLVHGRVWVEGDVLTAENGFAIRIMNGCNGINVIVLLWSAMLAWPAGAVRKLKGVVLGGLVIQAANLVRVITLYYLGQWNMAWFGFMHAYAWEILIMLVGLGVFAVWSRGTLARAGSDPAT